MSFLRSFVFAVFLCSQVAEADDYYVDLDAGNDASSGSQVAPWRTLTHALATVAPSSRHRVLVRGTANLSSPGEVFPLRLPAGISLEAWDAQQGAVLDAEYLPCLEIVGPAPREQSLRGYERNLRFLGVPAISVEVQGVEESVDLVFENCAFGGELRMILAEVVGQTRRGSCALTLRSCNLSDVTVDCRSSSISTTEDVLSVSVEDSVGGSLHLRGLSAPTRPLVLRSSRLWDVHLESCTAASVSIVDNDFGWMHSELSASSILYERNRLFGSCAITAQGRLEVLSNTTELGIFEIRGSGTTRIERNAVPNGWIEFDSIGALEAPCSILRNGTTFLKVAAIGSQPMTIAENYVSAKMTLSALPHATVDIVGNVVSQWADAGTGIDLRPKLVPWIPGAPLVTIADNRLDGLGEGAGIFIAATLAKLVIERNEIQSFEIGIQVKANTVVHGTPNGWNCRIERNSILPSFESIGVELDLSSSQEDLRFLNNEILGSAEALKLNRDTYRGTIRCWNNIFRSYGS
ncbi:MAG: DUF1565 domain-containing protein, partial [Planctomycetes bacterium]|nr:DUF1565 domain-containing protein [Planctomycetota bacterium]